MYNEDQAKALVEKAYPGAKAVDCFAYESVFVVRVEHPDPDEKDQDPFLSVDQETGEVKEFSVINADQTALMKAFNERKK